MEYKCDLITDEIWEHARAGEDLPPDIREHVAECPKCRRVAGEVQAIIPMMQVAASCIPPAPDCRCAVMERISARPIWRSAWAYAAASVLLIAVIVTGLLAMQSDSKRSTTVVREPRHEVRQQSVEQPKLEAPEPPPAPVIEKSPKIERPKRIHLLPKQRPTRLVKHTPRTEPAKHEIPAGPEPEQVVTFDNEPVAAVAVTWPSADQQSDGWSGYTNTDTTTGEVTTCRVERSGDSVSIYLESKVPGEMPGKGA